MTLGTQTNRDHSEPKHKKSRRDRQQKQEKTGISCDMITFLNIRVKLKLERSAPPPLFFFFFFLRFFLPFHAVSFSFPCAFLSSFGLPS